MIAIGDAVAVLGTSVREPDPQGEPTGYRNELPTRVRLSGSQKFPLLIASGVYHFNRAAPDRREPRANP